MEKAASAVVRRATDSTGVTLLPPDFLLTMYCCGSEVTDSEDTGAIYSAERERERYEHGRKNTVFWRLREPVSSSKFTFACFTDLKAAQLFGCICSKGLLLTGSRCNNPTRKHGNNSVYSHLCSQKFSEN